MEDAVYESGEDNLSASSTLILYTDGIPEAMNTKKELFDDVRFHASIIAGRSLPTDGLRDRIVKDVKVFIGKEPPSDDMTLLLIRRS
jgi:sigma-B regulation protein RsbU (phosphoserine phosphatase)